MAKLRPLSKPEEIAAVPKTEPVLIQLEPDVTSFEADPGAADVTEAASDTGSETKSLEDQITALKAASAQDQERITKAENDRREALRLADQRAQEAQQAKTQNVDTQKDFITSSLSGAESDVAMAKSKYAAAMDKADWAAAADAQAEIADATTRIREFKNASLELDARKADAATRQETPAQQASDPIAVIEANPNLLPQEKSWLKQHPEAFIDRKYNIRLEDGYNRAMDKGLSRGSPEYLAFLDQHMGYAQNNGQQEERNSIMAAPVSREQTNTATGRTTNTQITLTPAQREIAQTMGISEVEYAKGVQWMNGDKRSNPEKYGNRG